MKYLLGHDKNQTLTITEMDDLIPQSNQVHIAVKASGINRADLLQLAGHYPPPAGESTIVGLEVSGVVIRAPATSPFQPGDKVMALLCGGGWASQVCVDVGCVMKMPASLSFIAAAALPEAFITAYQALFELAKLSEKLSCKKARVLIHAGASGVGSAAIQLAKKAGAEVFTTASTDLKLNALSALGADHVINYKSQDFCQQIATITQGEGIDVIVDFIGGDYLKANIDALAVDGALVNLAMLGGRFGDKFDFAKVLSKRLTIMGSTLRNRDYQYKAALISQFSEQFLSCFERGELLAVVDSDYHYDSVDIALKKMSSNLNIGKLILHSFERE